MSKTNLALYSIYNINGTERTVQLTSKDLKDLLCPDNGMPFSMAIDITDEDGRNIRIGFDQDGSCKVYDLPND